MADYALNRYANSLVSNDRDNQGKFTPVLSMVHVAGENNYFQHGNYLFGCGEGDLDELEDDVQLCQVIGGKKSGTKKSNASSSEPGTETEEQTNRRKLPSCPVCKKSSVWKVIKIKSPTHNHSSSAIPAIVEVQQG